MTEIPPDSPPSAGPSGATPSPESDRRRQVYVVDDESAIRRSLSFSLTTAGFEVRTFGSGRDFLGEVDALAPGCVLLDLRMADFCGFTVLEKLGERQRLFPVVAMTGFGDVQTAVEAMKRGARDFLEKPFPDELLLEALEALFSTLRGEVEAGVQQIRAAGLVAGLTPRERELLQGLLAGLSNKGVANLLGVSVRTIEMHRGNLMARLGVKSLADAVRIALAAGLKPL
jgi:two-component system response regulator FixJ